MPTKIAEPPLFKVLHAPEPVKSQASSKPTTTAVARAAAAPREDRVHLGSLHPPLDAPSTLSGTTVWTSPATQGERQGNPGLAEPRPASRLGWQNKLGVPEAYTKAPRLGRETERGGHVLGAGTVGKLKVFQHKETAAYVVLKKLGKENAPTGKVEFEMANRVNSPHVVRPFFYAQATDGRAYVLSPLVDGVTLAGYKARDGRVLTGALLDIFTALCAVHAADMTHNDTGHAGNIMIDHRGVGKLIDFGTATRPLRPFSARQDLITAFAVFAPKLREAGVPADSLQKFNTWLIAQKKPLPTRASIAAQPLFAGVVPR